MRRSCVARACSIRLAELEPIHERARDVLGDGIDFSHLTVGELKRLAKECK